MVSGEVVAIDDGAGVPRAGRLAGPRVGVMGMSMTELEFRDAVRAALERTTSLVELSSAAAELAGQLADIPGALDAAATWVTIALDPLGRRPAAERQLIGGAELVTVPYPLFRLHGLETRR